jgi:predicted Zn-dependent protease
MGNVRIASLVSLLLVGAGLIHFVTANRINTPLGRTLSPLFSLFGQSTKAADRVFSRILPIDEIDEQALGDALNFKIEAAYGTDDYRLPYLNDLVSTLAQTSQKPFQYRVYVAPGPANAFALPGGIIIVTEGMLQILESEAELVSVLGHEMGHVELGHCFDSARFEMVNRKLGGQTLGEIADTIYGFMARSSFSKTQEKESDDYGFGALTSHGYDPMATADAFERLQKEFGRTHEGGVDPFRDYFSSHPPLALRIENFRERGKRYLANHPNERFYVGRTNASTLQTRARNEDPTDFRN